MPGISAIASRVLVAEIGVDMSRFPTAGHLVSWAGLCPRMDETAGRKRTTHIRDGDKWLKTVLVQCAWAAIRKRSGAERFKSLFNRVKVRRGAMKAVVAVAALLLKTAHHLLRLQVAYEDKLQTDMPANKKNKAKKALVRRLRELGFGVEITELAVA